MSVMVVVIREEKERLKVRRERMGLLENLEK
jgi:hypothetical protein